MEKAAQFDRETCRWIILGEASDVHRSKEERLVIETLRSSGPLNVKVIMLAFNQAIRPFKSFAGIVFFATTTNGPVESRATGSKSFSKSYWSAKVAPATTCDELLPKLRVPRARPGRRRLYPLRRSRPPQ
jgi:hypothetical protein